MLPSHLKSLEQMFFMPQGMLHTSWPVLQNGEMTQRGSCRCWALTLSKQRYCSKTPRFLLSLCNNHDSPGRNSWRHTYVGDISPYFTPNPNPITPVLSPKWAQSSPGSRYKTSKLCGLWRVLSVCLCICVCVLTDEGYITLLHFYIGP